MMEVRVLGQLVGEAASLDIVEDAEVYSCFVATEQGKELFFPDEAFELWIDTEEGTVVGYNQDYDYEFFFARFDFALLVE